MIALSSGIRSLSESESQQFDFYSIQISPQKQNKAEPFFRVRQASSRFINAGQTQQVKMPYQTYLTSH